MNRREFIKIGTIGLASILLEERISEARHIGKLETAQPPKNHIRNFLSDNALVVYYLTNSWALYDNDKIDIRKFFKEHKNAGNFIVEGYADPRGSLEDNIDLGQNRAHGVEQFFRQLNYNEHIDIVSHGESKAKGRDIESYKIDRKVTIVAGENLIKRAIDKSPADVYVIDASGSMSEGNKWKAVADYIFPKKSKIYAFNGCINLKEILNIGSLFPDCGTPLWDSIGDLLDRFENKRITVLTDGDDTGSIKYSDIPTLVNLANRKKNKVSTIAIGSGGLTKSYLRKLASETMGRFYELQ